MLRLTLVRHAKAEPAESGQEDWDRPLAPRGLRDAPAMSQRLMAAGRRKPDLILSSPAVRAITTATIIARELGIASRLQQDERLYLASAKDLLAVVRELGGGAKHLMLVGHNPGLSEFADRLSQDCKIENLPTCGVYTVELDVPAFSALEWSSGRNTELDWPKKST